MIDSRLAKNLHNLEKILFFLTILFLPTQLGKHFWPSFSFVYSLRIDYLSPTVYFWDLLVLFLILTFFLNILLSNSLSRVNKTAAFILLFFFSTQFASVAFAQNPGAALVRLKEYSVSLFFAFYLASAYFPDIKKTLMMGLLWAVIGSCLLGISQFLAGRALGLWILGERNFNITTPLISKFNFYDLVFLRPYATFPHPNLLSGFLLATLPLLLGGLDNSLRGFKAMLGLIVSSTVFITFSRPGAVIAGVYMAVFFRKGWKLLLIMAVIIAPLAFVRFASVFTFDSLAVLRREELSEFALKLFLQSPVTGIGLNNFVNALASSEVLVGTSRFLQPVHNIFLLVLSETGLLGLLGFLGILGSAFWVNLNIKDPFSKALLASLLTIIFLGMFDHYFLTLPQGQRLFFMVIGLSLRNLKHVT